MQKLVVYDSQYGNTQKIAEVIAGVIGAKAVNYQNFDPAALKNTGLLIVGSPTQGGRATAGLQAVLDSIPAEGLRGIKFAVFDTRFLESEQIFGLKLLLKTIGYAASKISVFLKSKGGEEVVPPEGFIVKEKSGPLADGEPERAKKWAESFRN